MAEKERCYDCGRLIPEGKVRRRSTNLGTTRISLCPRCVSRGTKRFDALGFGLHNYAIYVLLSLITSGIALAIFIAYAVWLSWSSR